MARRMLGRRGAGRERREGEARLKLALETGRAAERAEAMVQAQGGDPRVVNEPRRLPRAGSEARVPAPRPGFVSGVDARALGDLLVSMGGGRQRMEDEIDPAVGIRILRKVGEPVKEGEPLAILEVRRSGEAPAHRALQAFTIGEDPVAPGPLVLEEVV